MEDFFAVIFSFFVVGSILTVVVYYAIKALKKMGALFKAPSSPRMGVTIRYDRPKPRPTPIPKAAAYGEGKGPVKAIGEFLALEGTRYLAVDLETNGFKPPASVLSISAWLIDTTKEKWFVPVVLDRYYFPREAYNSGATDVNGLTKEEITKRRGACTYPEHFEDDHDVQAFLASATHVIGHNMKFDLQWMQVLKDKPGFDTMNTNTNVLRIPKSGGGYKWPKLSEAAEFYGIKLDPSKLHQSLYDIELTARVFHAMVLRAGPKPVPYLVIEDPHML